MEFLQACPPGGLTQLPEGCAASLGQQWTLLVASAGSQLVLATPDTVLKLFKTPEQSVAQFRAWGKELGDDPAATDPGDSLRSAQGKLQQVFAATTLAWRELRDESALLGIHLGATDSGLSVAGPEGPLLLDRVPFVLQRRAIEARMVLEHRVSCAEDAAAFGVLLDWLNFTDELRARGIVTHRNFDENYGYLDGRMVLLDVGEIRMDAPHAQRAERTQPWLTSPAFTKLADRHPGLAAAFRKESQRRYGVPERERPGESWLGSTSPMTSGRAGPASTSSSPVRHAPPR